MTVDCVTTRHGQGREALCRDRVAQRVPTNVCSSVRDRHAVRAAVCMTGTRAGV